MNVSTATSIQFYDYLPEQADLRNEVLKGLKRQQPSIAPKFFYDETGSRIFDDICETPEYYVTRTEIKILEDNIDEISQFISDGCLLIEPGSGSSQKVRALLEVIEPHAYLPMDISGDYLQEVATKLAQEYPRVEIHAVCIDYTKPIDIPKISSVEDKENIRRIAFFPGSSIGNFEPAQAALFLENIAQLVGNKGGLLIGVDLKKNTDLLNAAYNDAKGYTAAFNLNLLQRANNELKADFDIAQFSHHAFYNPDKGRVEMHLRSNIDQQVLVEGQCFDFKSGDSIHTENSYKYTIEEVQQLAQQAGFKALKVWTDQDSLFSVHYFETVD